MLRRMLAMMLSIAMLITMLPVQTFASGSESTETETEVPAAQTTEAAETGACVETEPVQTGPETTAAAEEETEAKTSGETSGSTVPSASEETRISAAASGELTASEEAGLAAGAASGTCGDDITWSLSSDYKVVTLSGSGGMYDYDAEEKSPWYGYRALIQSFVVEPGITHIGAYACYNHENLANITLPDSVTSMGENAFAITALTAVTLPPALTAIPKGAFYNCTSLTSVSIPSTVEEIGVMAFDSCSALKTVTLPEGVAVIGNLAFSLCSKLESIVIPRSAVTISNAAFSRSSKLMSVYYGGTEADWNAIEIVEDSTESLLPDGAVVYYANPVELTSDDTCTIAAAEGSASPVSHGGSFSFTVTPAEGYYAGPDFRVLVNGAALEDPDADGIYVIEDITQPQTVTAEGVIEVTEYPLRVNGTVVTSANISGTNWRYDPEGNILYLEDGFSGSASSQGEHLTIEVSGGINAGGLYASTGSMTLRGKTGRNADSVTIGGYSSVTVSEGDLTVENVTLKVTTQDDMAIVVGSSGGSPTGCLTVKNAYVYGYSKGEEAYEGIYVGTLKVLGNSYVYGRTARPALYGIYAAQAGSSFSSECHVAADANVGSAMYLAGGVTLPEYAYVMDYGVYGGMDYELVSTASVFGSGTYSSNRSFAYVGVDHASYQQNTDGTTHSLVCSCSSYPMGAQIACSGGEATCKDKAVCAVCGSGYGEISDKHSVDISTGLCEICGEPVNSCGENLIYALEDGVLHILGDGAMTDYASGGAPWYASREEITQVSLPEGITSLGAYAFEGCTGLTAMAVPETVTAIGENAFSGCGALAVTYAGTANQWRQMGNKVQKTICADGVLWDFGSCGETLSYMVLDDILYISGNGEMADYASGGAPWYALREKIAGVSLAENVTSLGAYAFEGCAGLTELEISENVTAIGENAFSGCGALVVTYAGTANQWRLMGYKMEKTICSDGVLWDFGSCGDNLVYMLLDDTLQIFPEEGVEGTGAMTDVSSGGAPWYALREKVAKISLAEGVTVIGAYALEGCVNVSTIDIPASVATINRNAFSGCTGLTHIYIPETVTTIRASSYTYSPFSGCSEELEIYCLPSVRPKGWGSYWNHQAYGVVLTTTFGCDRENYNYWSTLDKTAPTVDIPEYVTLIPVKAFYNRTTLTGVTIPDSVTVIHNNAFTGCSNLRHIFIPASVTTIIAASSSHAPFDGTNVKFYYDGRQAPDSGWGEYWNYGVSTVWGFTREEYNQWCDLDLSGPNVVLPEGITSIPYKAFANRSDIASIQIPGTVTTIGESAFYCCSGLTSVTIPESVTAISGKAFALCSSLSDVIIMEGVTKIGEAAFYCCRNLTSVMIPGTVTTIRESAFYNCSALTDLAIPEGVEAVEENAFGDCSGLLTVSLPASLTELATTAFKGCNNVVYYWVDDLSATFACDEFGALFNKDMTTLLRVPGSLLGVYDIPDSVAVIAAYAFYGCDGLEEIVFNSGLREVQQSAFSGCSGLTSIRFPDGLERIDACAFEGCGLDWIFIPESVTSLGGTDEYGGLACEADTSIFCGFDSPREEWGSYWDKNGGIQLSVFYGCTGAEMEYWDKLDKTASVIEIPAGIAAIPNEAFAGCTGLTDVIIPEGVTGIGMNAFKDCTGLTRIHIPLSVKNIYSKPFQGCSSELEVYITLVADLYPTGWASDWRVCDSNNTYLTVNKGYTRADMLLWPSVDTTAATIVLPEGIETIIPYAFFGSNTLESVVIPDSVTRIENMAFAACNNLTSVTIPTSVTTIKQNAFSGNENLTITYEGTVEQWLAAVGSGTGKVKTVCTDGIIYYWGDFGQSGPDARCAVVDDTLRINGSGVLYGNDDTMNSEDDPLYDLKGQITKAELSDGITAIENWSFWDFVSLTDITLPSSVTGIGEYAFFNCCSLTGVTIPEGVTYIGNHAFENCGELVDIAIPKSVTSIGESAFIGCQMTSVTIPEGVTSIASDTFNSCTALTSVTIQGAVTSIGSGAFSSCSSLSSIDLPGSVTSIGDYAFWGCDGLTDMTIPDSVTEIGTYAFVGCENLVITFRGTVEQWISAVEPTLHGEVKTVCTDGTVYCWGECGDDLRYYLLDNKLIIFGTGEMNQNGWSSAYRDRITEVYIAEGATTIGSSAFSEHRNLTKVEIPSSVKTIGGNAFIECTSLTEVTMQEGMTTIGSQAFYNCTSLAEITIPGSVAAIEQNAFYNTALRQIVIPGSVTTIGNGAFSGCGDLTELMLREGVAVIGEAAFSECSSLTALTMPNSVTGIGYAAFANCSSLTDVLIPASVTDLGGHVFSSCTSLKEVTIQKGIAAIGEYAFADCSSLTSVTLPEGLASIGAEAFVRCSKLEHIVIPETVTEIGARAFAQCDKLSAVTISESVTSIGEYAFQSCGNLTEVTIPAGVTSVGKDAFAYCEDLTITYLGTLEQWLTAAVLGDCGYRDVICSDAVLHCWDRCGEDLTYQLVDTKLTITGSGEMTSYGWYGQKITEVSLPEGLTTICDEAFYQSNDLTQITIPESVTSIGQYAFFSCKGAPSLTIPKNVTYIGYYAFAWNDGMKEIIFEGDAPAFGDYVFAGDTITAFYPRDNSTWTEDVMQNYGGTVTWKPICVGSHTPAVTPASAPTCTQSGWTEGSHCADCGKILTFREEIPALGHTEVIDEAVEPTCTEPGLTEGVHCSVCGEVLTAQEKIPALGHTEVIDEAVEPTCTESGLTEGVHCSVCGEVLAAQTVIDALGHTEVIDEAVEPTCTESGLTEGRHCSACGEVLVAQTVIDALGHTEVIDQAVAPTCTETGLTEGKHCSVCDEVLIAQEEIPALGHTEVIDEAVEPTCTESGLTEGKHCSVCSEVLTAQEVIPALGHTEVIDQAVEPTCTESGLTEGRHCSVCNEVLISQIVVEAKGHSFSESEITTPPTCTEAGVKTGKCTVCGETATEPVPALGHTEVIDQAVAPACTETGLTEGKHCSVCNEVLDAQEVVPATGHTEAADAAAAPTCTETGLTEGSHCSACGEILTAQEVLPALGHDFSLTEITTPPTCTEEGSRAGACARCGEAIEEPVPALGHTEVIDPAVVPTCVKSGLTEGSHCEVCGEVLVARELIPAEGHCFEENICLTCGAEDRGDYASFGGKTLTLKYTDPETGKVLTSKQIKWSLPEEYAPYATLTAAGKLTAKKVVEKVRVEAVGTIVGDEAVQVIVTADILPAVTQVEILEGETVLNDKTLNMDVDEESRTFTVQAYPLDTAQDVTWSISDAGKLAFADYTIDGNTLTVANPTGKAGTVTVKATVNAGVKKTVSFKLSFSNFAEKVTITNTEETIISGNSLQLAAVVSPEDVTKTGVTWKLQDPDDKAYVTLSSKGVLKAKTVYAEREVSVIAVSKDGAVESEPYTVTIMPRDTGMLILRMDGENVTKATVNVDLNTETVIVLDAENMADGTAADVTWKSSNKKIASVEDGVVTIHTKGSAVITAAADDGRKTTVTLKIAALTSSITIGEPEDGLEVASGKTLTLKAFCEDGASSKVVWTITKGAEYAKIAKSGKLTANKDITSAKEVLVRATAADGSGVYEEAVVTIRPIAQGVQIYSEQGGRTLFSVRTNDSLWVRSNTTLEWAMNESDILQLSARVYPSYEEDSLRNAIQGVTWKSSGPKIATVDEDGMVTCLKPGTVTITATAKDGSGKKVTFKLKVIKKIETLFMEDQEVKGGKSLNLAKLLEINPTDATNKTFTWEIIGGDGAAYATISTKGVLKTKKVKTPVEVELRVTAKDGSGESAEFAVTINP